MRLRVVYELQEIDTIDLTPADINYLFGIELEAIEYDFDIAHQEIILTAATSEINNYLRGVDIAFRKKLDELGANFIGRSEYVGDS